MSKKKILFAGESWTSFTTHVKGFDTFSTCVYEEGKEYIERSIERAGYEFVYLPGQHVAERFPRTAAELSEYACIVLSDIGSNTLLLSDDTFKRGLICTNRCDEIKKYVLNGGSFLMIGGYLSFSGIDCKARYGQTSIQDILPVTCLSMDDRAEHPEGIYPRTSHEHSAIQVFEEEWPPFLGYNRTLPKEGSDIPVLIGGDPLVAFGKYGEGKSAAFTSDCSPHWGSPQFVSWEKYDLLWKGIFEYLTKKEDI